ncbi:MAG: hypothetical protein K5979_11770 [Ruminococcus sp.]|nr:hypothetical protein [Ruminococcus sp.]
MAVFYNQASLSYNGNVALSNIITGEIIETLTASKEAVDDQYTAGSDTSFVISIVNSGATGFTDLTVTDDLGRYTFGDAGAEVVPLTYSDGSVKYYINGIQQAAPTVDSTDPLTLTGISVPAGGNALIIYEASVNSYAPFGVGASITNNVDVSSNARAVLATASTTITPEENAELSITKALSPTAVQDGGELTYTFVISNSGSVPVTTSDSVVFNDVFDPALNITSVTFNGTPWTAGTNYTYTPATGTFTSTQGQITVPAAEYVQDPNTGAWSVQPGESTLIITGTLASE